MVAVHARACATPLYCAPITETAISQRENLSVELVTRASVVNKANILMRFKCEFSILKSQSRRFFKLLCPIWPHLLPGRGSFKTDAASFQTAPNYHLLFYAVLPVATRWTPTCCYAITEFITRLTFL
jgi:hypothetical protein